MSRRIRLVCLYGLMLTGALPAAGRAHASSLAELQPMVQNTIAAIPLDGAAAAGGLVMQAHVETLRPAPLPDPDVSAPGLSGGSLAAQGDASVSPGVFNSQSHFAGDGYAPGSSMETDHAHRHSTGGGMSLSIPMQ